MFHAELEKLRAEMRRRYKGLMQAKGRMAEAEALAEEINRVVGDEYFVTCAPCATSHSDGDCYVRVLVLNNHAAARAAIRQLGIAVAAEHEYGDQNILHLRDFSATVNMCSEPKMAVAA